MAFELIDLKPGQDPIAASLKLPLQVGAGAAAAWLLLNGFRSTEIVTAVVVGSMAAAGTFGFGGAIRRAKGTQDGVKLLQQRGYTFDIQFGNLAASSKAAVIDSQKRKLAVLIGGRYIKLYDLADLIGWRHLWTEKGTRQYDHRIVLNMNDLQTPSHEVPLPPIGGTEAAQQIMARLNLLQNHS